MENFILIGLMYVIFWLVGFKFSEKMYWFLYVIVMVMKIILFFYWLYFLNSYIVIELVIKEVYLIRSFVYIIIEESYEDWLY